MNHNVTTRHAQLDIRALVREGRISREAKAVLIDNKRYRVTTTPVHLGGCRMWWQCPTCGRRCAIIYSDNIGELYRCRQCLRLTYPSQQTPHGTWWPYYDGAAKIARKLDPTFNPDGVDWMLLREASWFPDKPRFMHWSKYERMQQRFRTLRDKGNDLNYADLMGAAKRMGYTFKSQH
jgi:hypothetical protein